MEGNISNNSQDLLYNTQRINWFVAFYVNAIKQNRYFYLYNSQPLKYAMCDVSKI